MGGPPPGGGTMPGMTGGGIPGGIIAGGPIPGITGYTIPGPARAMPISLGRLASD